jgi:hypothetical protein
MLVPVQVDATGIIVVDHGFGHAPTPVFPDLVINHLASETGDYRTWGYVTDAPLGPNMAWCRPFSANDALNVLLTSDNVGGFELYTTAQEPGAFGWQAGTFFGRVDSFAPHFTTLAPGVRRLNLDNLPFKELIKNLAGGDQNMGGGCPVDITYYDEPNTLYIYFLQRRQNGDQTIFRIKATYEFIVPGQLSTINRYTLFSIHDSENGIVSWADVALSNGGAGANGLENLMHWNKFKVSRSPVIAGSGVNRVETIATIGRGVTSGSGDINSALHIWKFEDSLANTPSSKLATFVVEHTADSGNTFVGINAVNGITNPGNLFDRDTSTSGLISNGDDITLEFSKVLTFNRVEFLWNSPPSGFLGVAVESSFDNVTFENVLNIPSGILGASPSLVKASAEYDISNPSGENVDYVMDGFTGKYVRLTFSAGDATPRDVREIKLYGAHSTAGFISTSGWNSQLVNPVRESFNVANTGLPSGWRTYGDFTWFTDNGVHESGFFSAGAGAPPISTWIGNHDFTAVRPQRDTLPNTSGVLEVDVNVGSTEDREISFDIKWDLLTDFADSLIPSDPNDDYVLFYVIEEDGTIVDHTSLIQIAMPTTPWDYKTVSLTINSPGKNTLRWVYKRGTEVIGLTPFRAEAAAWIDNVLGLDAVDSAPNLLTTIWGHINGSPTITDENINAYAGGAEPASGVINAYVNPLFGTPSGVVNAYHAGETEVSGMVYGYTSALREFGDVYGYVDGVYATPTGSVNAYIFTSGAFDLLYGHMQNRLNESINGFLLGPSGAFNSINAYVATPQFLAVNGYMKVTEDEQIQVNAYLKANGFGDQVNGYMFASGLNHQSYGYINADGIVGNINAYIRSVQETSSAGYIEGHEGVSGVINAWISGIAAISDSFNGYVPAISGDISENINGYVGGLELPDSSLNAHIIGFGGSGNCTFPVPNPPSVPSPTGNFFN